MEFHGVNAGNSLDFLRANEFMPIKAIPCQVIEKYCQGDDSNPLLLIANGCKGIVNDAV